MKMLKIIGIVFTAATILTFVSEIGEQLSIPGTGGLVVTAEARIGRPLTPVSVAGVGRRTVRRCAVGVYNCQLPEAHAFDDLLGLVSSEPVLKKEFSPSSLLALRM